MVVSEPPEAVQQWFDSLVDRSLPSNKPTDQKITGHRMESDEWLEEVEQAISDGTVEPIHLAILSKGLPKLGRACRTVYVHPVHRTHLAPLCPFQLALDYLHALFQHPNSPWVILPQDYLNILTNWECWSNPEEVGLIAEQLDQFVMQDVRGPYAGPSSKPPDCLHLCMLIFRVLEWHVGALDTLILKQENSFDPNLVLPLLLRLIAAIKALRSAPFPALLIYIFLSRVAGRNQADPMSKLLECIDQCMVRMKELEEEAKKKQQRQRKGNDQNEGEEEEEEDDDDIEIEEERGDGEEKEGIDTVQLYSDCVRDLNELFNMFPEFANPPSVTWTPFREDFIRRRHRPAILTLGSIYAIFRVLKSVDEVADSFLTMGQLLGMANEQIVEDLLRAGFLIQLETVTSAVSADRREREALADVFVFFKLPQVLSKLLDLGIPRDAITTALGRICASASLLDELDAKKSDNVFRFFMDALRRLDVVGASEHEALVMRRDAEREQNEELLQHLRTAISGLSSSATTAEAAQMVKSRSELINRVQKAKSAIDRVVPEKTEEMLRKLIPHEVPIDMLCAIYCAHGELSSFSGWLAALNAQTQGIGTNEGVDAVASSPQGRLLIFDSTFLLMARIQIVFPDLRLEELVGARVHCAFFLWNKRYNNCLEQGEPMQMPPNGSILRDGTAVDENFRAQFRSQQFAAMRTHKTPFWNAEQSDLGAVLELVPLVGELLMEELQQGGTNEFNNVLCTFRHLSSLWLCLVQWLDTQLSTENPDSELNLTQLSTENPDSRQSMAKALREFELNWLKQQPMATTPDKDNGHERLGYSMLLARRTLKQMAEAPMKKEHPYTWLIGFAQRPLPALPTRKMSLLRVDKEELTEEKQRLKEVFLCTNQQGWASPDAIAHINRCNVSCRMDIWLHCWVTQLMNQTRIATVDEGELAAELCLATAFTYPVPCLCEMIKQLVERVLFLPPPATTSSDRSDTTTTAASSSTAPSTLITGNDSGDSQQIEMMVSAESATQQSPQQKRHPMVGELSPKATVMAKMLVRALQLLLWAGDRSVLGKQERERRLQQIYGTAGIGPSIGGSDKESRKRKHHHPSQPQTGNSLKPPMSAAGLETTSSEGSGGEELMVSNDKGNSSRSTEKGAGKGPSSTVIYSKQQQGALNIVRSVFERFNRIVRDCTLHPPVTFIIFFLHEMAQAPRTEYWRRLVAMMPVELVFVLSRLDPAALPLELFLRIYDPSDEHLWVQCMQYACMQRTLGQC